MEQLLQDRSTHECLHGYYYETDVLPSNMREFIAYVDRSRARLHGVVMQYLLPADDWFERRLRIIRGLLKIGT